MLELSINYRLELLVLDSWLLTMDMKIAQHYYLLSYYVITNFTFLCQVLCLICNSKTIND